MEGTPVDTCLLLGLPAELRHLIWECLLSSTTLTSGKYYANPTTLRVVKPDPNSLAILRTCRQTHRETKDIWLGLVLFEFIQIRYLVEKLAPLPLYILSQIRRVRLNLRAMVRPPTHPDDGDYHRIGSILSKVRGLQLKTLEVDGSLESKLAVYNAILSIVGRSASWEELRVFISCSGDALSDSESSTGDARDHQPDSEPRTLRGNDSEASTPEVTLFRAKRIGAAPGPAYYPPMHETFEQYGQQGAFGDPFEDDDFLMSGQDEVIFVETGDPDAKLISGHGSLPKIELRWVTKSMDPQVEDHQNEVWMQFYPRGWHR